jgi:cell division transport system permease protein
MSKTKNSGRKKKLGSYPHFTVVFSITISLFVIGLFAILFMHARKLSKVIQENIELHVYLNHNIDELTFDLLRSSLSYSPYVLKKNGQPQIVHISKEAAAKKFIEETGEDFTLILNENPLRESFVLKINPFYYEGHRLKDVAEGIERLNGVFEVDYPVNLINEINKNIRTISIVLISFSVLLLITTILLINNTIKLALYSQRFLIRSMQLVGARQGFIQRPFLWRATLQGFISGIIAVALLSIILQYAYNQVGELVKLREVENIFVLFALILLLGIVLGLFSSYRAVNKYMKMSLDQLY